MGRVKKRSRSDGVGYVNVHGFHPREGDVAQAQYNSTTRETGKLGNWETGQLSFALLAPSLPACDCEQVRAGGAPTSAAVG